MKWHVLKIFQPIFLILHACVMSPDRANWHYRYHCNRMARKSGNFLINIITAKLDFINLKNNL